MASLPRCWGLIAYAEDKARCEKLDKIRRKLQQDNLAGRAMPSDWSEANPWNACLRALATDEEYWSEQVRHPAAAWTFFGGHGTPMAPAEQAALVHAPGGQNIELEPEARTDDRRKQSNRDRGSKGASHQGRSGGVGLSANVERLLTTPAEDKIKEKVRASLKTRLGLRFATPSPMVLAFAGQ